MNIDKLKSHALAARRDIVTMIYESGIGHPGGALSIIDILTWIYHQEIDLDESPRARVVMSKGHAVAAQYALLFQKGKIDRSEFNSFRQINSRLQGHPSVKSLPEVDATTGLLGQGLSVALGMAAAKKHAQDPASSPSLATEKCTKVRFGSHCSKRDTCEWITWSRSSTTTVSPRTILLTR